MVPGNDRERADQMTMLAFETGLARCLILLEDIDIIRVITFHTHLSYGIRYTTDIILVLKRTFA